MVYQLDHIKSKELIPGFHGKMIHGNKSTMAYWRIDKDATVQMHQHPHEQVVNVFEGTFEMNVGEQTHVLNPGDVLLIPSETPHGGRAITPCYILDVFAPVREEYR